MAKIRHKVFISYYQADQDEVVEFVNTFDEERDVFIARVIGTEMSQDIIDSNDPAYVMRRIRELYLGDSTVTIVMIGKCTWARRYVDWELQATLRHRVLGLTPRKGGIRNRIHFGLSQVHIYRQNRKTILEGPKTTIL